MKWNSFDRTTNFSVSILLCSSWKSVNTPSPILIQVLILMQERRFLFTTEIFRLIFISLRIEDRSSCLKFLRKLMDCDKVPNMITFERSWICYWFDLDRSFEEKPLEWNFTRSFFDLIRQYEDRGWNTKRIWQILHLKFFSVKNIHKILIFPSTFVLFGFDTQ